MKKSYMAAALALAAGMSTTAMAAPTAFQGNVTVKKDSGSYQCALLGENVKVGLSSNVHGALECHEADNTVKVAACHEGGRRSPLTCVNSGTASVPVWNHGNCTAAGDILADIPDYKSYGVSSDGGVVAEYLLSGKCTAATIVATDLWD